MKEEAKTFNTRLRVLLLNVFFRAWYSYISRLDGKGKVAFLNYGYQAENDERLRLAAEDEDDRYPIQLYHYVASHAPLAGKDVLEVGSGRGGGAAYLARYMHPTRLVGLDRCRRAIRSSKIRYADVLNLSFVPGDAHRLPFADGSFDIVVSVETAHHYSDMDRFISEVFRTLRPGGHFLMACYEFAATNAFPRQALARSAFDVVKDVEITPEILRSLDADSARRRQLIESNAPRALWTLMAEFAGLPGTRLYQSFVTGERPYFFFVCRKDADPRSLERAFQVGS